MFWFIKESITALSEFLDYYIMPEKILSKIYDIFLGLAVCTEVALIAISPFIYAISGRVVLIGLAVCFCIFMSWLGINIYCDILTELRELNKKNKS